MNWEWVFSHLDFVGELLLRHLYLTFVPLGIAFVAAMIIGMVCARRAVLFNFVLGTSLVFYSLPTIAVIVVLLPLTGLNDITIIIPLSVYAFAILIRNVVDGLRGVPEAVRDSAKAMGYGPTRQMVQIDLPLAIPVIVAGLRITSVSAISFVTVSSLIGISSLGDLFIDGFQRDFPTEVIIGLVATVLVAVIADWMWVRLGAVLAPWNASTQGK